MFARALRRSAGQLRNRSYATPASDLDATLRTALKLSMKARDSVRTSTIRSILADLQNSSHLPSPPPPAKTLAKSIAARIDGAEIFKTSGRDDLAAGYLAEVAILKEFTAPEPVGLPAEELDGIVRSVMAELGIVEVTGKEMGRVIKAVVLKVGDSATGKAVSEAVKRATTS